MDALRKQASKLREQVAKQQQAVIKQFSGTGYESSDVMVIDEVELHRHQQLEKLYRSTRSGKDFQKDIVRAAESFTNIGCKHIEVGMKFSEDCCKYGSENVNNGDLAKAASLYGSTLVHLEKEYEEFNRVLSSQIMEPLKQMITGAPLEDARHLAQRYSRMRHEAELQAAEISRRQSRVREVPIPDNSAKLQLSEAKMQELKANMAVLGKEAASALAALESQQHRLTLQRLVAMIEAEKSFHLRLAAILDEVEAEIVSDKQRKESAPPTAPNPTSRSCIDEALYFLSEVMHPFEATSANELNLTVGDYVVVRQVTPTGWAEGECRGRAGWFPVAYVEKRHSTPTSRVVPEAF
uniref:Intersectin-1 n=1 Tax=Anthurium amnicola TaxID=1678845 RepID=A0A1D1ZE14_9ARAE